MKHQHQSYHFAVYNHKLVVGKNRLITRNFIVIKNKNGDIIAFTRLHNYIHSKRKYASKSISDNGNNRSFFVAQFLNYVFFSDSNYEITLISEITIEIVQKFFYYFGSENPNGIGRSKITVDKCAIAVIDFLLEYIIKNPCKLKKQQLVTEKFYYNKRGKKIKYYLPQINIVHSATPKVILRDMPNSVFNLFLSYAASYHKEILILIALSAFAGLRPSEACNVRQENSPLGPGMFFSRVNNKITEIKIDLKKEYVLRSDLKVTGFIKKEREQKVYPNFINIFVQCYRIYCDYILTQKFELDYMPLSVNRNGKAMTYPNYLYHFRKMVKELIPIMLNHPDLEIQEYAQLLTENNISPHIFRHWFSVRLTLYGENVASLMYWRGDKNPESAITYLQNKSEIAKKFKAVTDEAFALMKEYSDKEADSK